MGHSIIFQYSMGLPGTDDPPIGEKFAVFKCSKSRYRLKKKNCFQLIDFVLEDDKIKTLGIIFQCKTTSYVLLNITLLKGLKLSQMYVTIKMCENIIIWLNENKPPAKTRHNPSSIIDFE